MPSHTTAFFSRQPNFRQSGSRQLSFRQLGTSLCFSGALATALGGCATLNSSPSASAEASSTPTAASHATAPVLQDSEGFRLFTGRGPVEEAVFEGPAAPASYSYVEFERRGEPEGTMKVSVSDGSGTQVEVVAGGSGEGAGVWVRNTASASAPSPSSSGSSGSGSSGSAKSAGAVSVPYSSARVTASTSQLTDDAEWMVSVRAAGIDSSGEFEAPDGVPLTSQSAEVGEIQMQGSRGFVHDMGGGSVAVENRSGAKMMVYCAGVDRKERSVPAGGRVFVEDLGVRASAGSPLFCGVVTSDSTASWNVTALGGRA
ncbi:hypothetical protein HMPREF2528_07665 [Rothia sp. HMSC078H08]|uniref:hypothetical protein n=1 Tax=Rothia sp. HMSC078H08 TaxID=1715008 RepID=UPI0008A45B96|nr:hypothetical protein [Rothia sp. HMSC078H08]OFN71216.1 hypothetical protein HMPREF2528_07665 [Rothia sp. HMSC078H08]